MKDTHRKIEPTFGKSIKRTLKVFSRASILALGLTTALVTMTTTARAAGSSAESNIRFSPLGLLVGSYNVNFDVQIAPDWSVGPELRYLRLNFNNTGTNYFDASGWGAAARLNWFANGTFNDGFYIGPSLGYESYSITYHDVNGNSESGTASGPYVSAIFGYGWFWESFNIMLGLGVTKMLNDNSITITDSNGNNQSYSSYSVGFAGEFSLGWTF